MYGRPRPYRPPGDGRRMPPAQPSPPVPNPNLYLPNLNNLYLQNTANPFFLQNPNNPYLQNPNLFIQNPNLFIQNPNFPIQNPSLPIQSTNNIPQQKINNNSNSSNNNLKKDKVSIEKIDRVAAKAHHEILGTGENVSAWKVSQAVLLELKVDSWSDFGFPMQEVPSLYRLILTEGKINAFIHCFVGVRRITSLYDLEVAICKNEGVKKFEELEVGPLVRHPLVLHYFSTDSDVSEVLKLTSQEIVSCLCELMDARNKEEIRPDELLDFIAKKRSVMSREKLGVRIQSLGMHITFVREARRSEDSVLKKYLKTSGPKSDKKSRKRPLFSTQKKQLDERFNDITQRITSFSSSLDNVSGKHIRFASSSSDGENDNPESAEDYSEDSRGKLLAESNKSYDRVSNCPYPSATEEMTRLGLKGEKDTALSPSSCSVRCSGTSGPHKKRRKFGNSSCTVSFPSKTPNRNEARLENNLSLDQNSIKTFITTWKEACRDQPADEVLDRMLTFYHPTLQDRRGMREKNRRKHLFTSYPCIAILNVAVLSIKFGMWDSIYDTFQAIGEHNCSNTITDSHCQYESIDIEPSEKTAVVIAEGITEHKQSITAEELIRKITAYFDSNHENPRNGKSPMQKQLNFFRNLCSCEAWLTEQFSVKEFKTLGHGEFFVFLENNSHLLPIDLPRHLTDDIFEKAPLEVGVLQNQLVFLISQALNNSWDGEIHSKRKISLLLMKQFPSILFNITENGPLESFFDMVKEQRVSVVSNCVLFSSTLFGTEDSLPHCEKYLADVAVGKTDTSQNARVHDHVASKDAIDVLLRAPMLLDLNIWLHWDLVYAPSLGPLVGWLLNEVNAKELLCMVTKDGSVIRINHSATMDSFLQALLQGSPFQAAVDLISLFSSFGGEGHVPMSLLKCHARQAFEVILKNLNENMEVTGNQIFVMRGKDNCGTQNVNNGLTIKSICEVEKNLSREHTDAPVPSRFILNCLSYLPSEFHSFAADVLLSGFHSVVKDAPSAILRECEQIEQRLMLHEIGLSLGVKEWIDDYYAFSCSNTDPLNSCNLSNSKIFIKGAEFSANSSSGQLILHETPFKNDKIVSCKADGHAEESFGIYQTESAEESSYGVEDGSVQNFSEPNDSKDAALVIESIRQEEFGLNPSVSNMESSMLKKQHARLGRALHCLSQELYSQDSHFLLELVQNADDNIYPEDVEPTIIFILQEPGIVVLNNEQGFSAHNIRALCDVGNSTKKGCGTGYIGQKGIGFKSVFRVSDAPEIHSNGFHVKFDISEGQIGFVLPTIVPPCDIKMFTKLASADTGQIDGHNWNTCIVLPFKSKLLGGVSNNITSMFSDLHPSLLLFLHRLRCIVYRNMLNDSLIVMRKEIVGDGIIKVSRGNQKMNWLVVSQKLQANAMRPDVQTTEISLAFTLRESDQGEYYPDLNLQPVFAFLPLRTYGLKFILQGDFILPSSREAVDGDSSWNQWLLSEFPSLFVYAERSFCALSCFVENPGKAVTAYMSFVPLAGEVHGFFSSLPRMITSKLRMSNCLLQEGDRGTWVPPCKVLRNWNENARTLLPDHLLSGYLGIGLLDKDIILSDSLANSLGIEEYGPKILIQVISSLCDTETGLKSLGLGWLCSWLNEFYNMVFHSSGRSSLAPGMELELMNKLRRIPFVPLSDGTHSSMEQGTIWLQSDILSPNLDTELGVEAFQNLNAKLRTVNPGLISAAATDDIALVENITKMLHWIGVWRLSAHEIIKIQILPALSDDRTATRDKMLMVEYISFVMLHLQSSCPDCHLERELIISELRNKAYILTNNGYQRSVDVSIHIGKEYGNRIDVKKLIDGIDLKWHEVDIAYLKHPITESLSCAQNKWREFFLELGITDFVQIVQVRKSLADVSHNLLKNIIGYRETISLTSVATDWECDELVHLLSLLSKTGNRDKCKYMLETLDLLWDDCFSDKVTGYCNTGSNGDDKPFKSSFMSSIYDVQWAASSMDDALHYPKDLFYDCDAVSAILGASAPYAVPKVSSGKLLNEIGFKTQVMIDDILALLQVWRRSTIPFNASLAQMCRFYSFIWNEMASSKQKIVEVFRSGSSIFVPYASSSKHEDIVPGIFLSSEEVYWHDSTGCSEQMKMINFQYKLKDGTPFFFSKILGNIYPGLHDFFVKECGVHEDPPVHDYLQILLQLSKVALPSQAANAVFQVFLRWAKGLKSSTITCEEIIQLKECLPKLEFTVLPTIQDKWVSLHPSFGIVCWCDDEKLKKEFKHLDNIDFLYFGNLSDDEQELLKVKVLVFMKSLGIPALSELVTREAIHYGLTDNSFKASLVDWALPYAQRYIHNLHPDKYSQLKQSGFENLNLLQIVTVEKLYSRNVIKKCDSVSEKRLECNSLLQGNILYTTRDSDPHSLFMELSRLLFNGTSELHLANFLHMITTMVESGSKEEQIEFFILNSQKLSKLPHEERVWSLSSVPLSTENSDTLEESAPTLPNVNNSLKSSRKPGINSNWPPSDWKTAPGFSYSRANGFRTQAAHPQQSSSSLKKPEGSYEHVVAKTDPLFPMEADANWTIEDEVAITTSVLSLPDSVAFGLQSCRNFNQVDSGVVFDPEDIHSMSEGPAGSSSFSQRPQLNTGNPNAAQAMLTGRLGELVASKYFVGKAGNAVTWVNEDSETGLPYDIVIGEDDNSRQYIEVKATKSARKDWFIISMREWQFAVEKGESFSIAYVVLSDSNTARISVFKNPVKLCQLGKLQLVVMIPKQQHQQDLVLVS